MGSAQNQTESAEDWPDAGADEGPDTASGSSASRLAGRFGAKFWVLITVIGLIAAMFLAAWLAREDIADSFIADELAANNLPATYEIESIGSRKQVFTDVVIGDPAAPDFTAERVVAEVEYSFGAPQISALTLTQPRIFASVRDGEASFGSLDPLIFSGTDEPVSLPDIELALEDGRALVETDFGAIGVKLDGEGNVSTGWEGVLAASTPGLAAGSCRGEAVSLYGTLNTLAGKPSFAGPVRARSLSCEGLPDLVQAFAAQVELSSDEAFSQLRAEADLSTGPARYLDYLAAGIGGKLRVSYRAETLDLDHVLTLRGARTPQIQFGQLKLDGNLRSRENFTEVEARSEIRGQSLRLGGATRSALDNAKGAGADSLAGPLLQKMTAAFDRALPSSVLEARLTARKSGSDTLIDIPSAAVRAPNGARLIALSRADVKLGANGFEGFTGNIASAGADLPRITGRMASGSDGTSRFRLTMEPYTAGESVLAMPEMTIVQGARGALFFDGRLEAGGPLADNAFVSGLRLPVSGEYRPSGALRLWDECIEISWDQLQLGALAVDPQALPICPGASGSIVALSQSGAVQVAAAAPQLRLSGQMEGTPLSLAASAVGLSAGGDLAARDVLFRMGERGAVGLEADGFEASESSAERPVGLALDSVTARLGGAFSGVLSGVFSGTFAGARVDVQDLPFELGEIGGNWRYANDVFALDEASVRVSDTAPEERFNPVVLQGGNLTFADGNILGSGFVHEPMSERVLAEIAVSHNLTEAQGFADITVPGLRFDEGLQPVDLTQFALGVIANAEGVVTGAGRIDWRGENLSSYGQFSSENFDFAAAFGPVKGVSGTIVFTDLVNLTTAPAQRLKIASINPGIEVMDGELEFSLSDGQLLSVNGGQWPFMGGQLLLRPTVLNFAVEEERRYTFEMAGLDAGTFINTLELSNLSASGKFDGTIPIVFDEEGNGRIEGGLLASRAPGGNVSYVGELTYEDMGAITNFAFDALRSLDYKQMNIGMEGPLVGEIVTRVRFDGVTQGKGAKSNIITRQLSQLPLQFRVNVRAQFYELLSGLKLLYDPVALNNLEAVREATDQAARQLQEKRGEGAVPAGDEIGNEFNIQEQESEDLP